MPEPESREKARKIMSKKTKKSHNWGDVKNGKEKIISTNTLDTEPITPEPQTQEPPKQQTQEPPKQQNQEPPKSTKDNQNQDVKFSNIYDLLEIISDNKVIEKELSALGKRLINGVNSELHNTLNDPNMLKMLSNDTFTERIMSLDVSKFTAKPDKKGIVRSAFKWICKEDDIMMYSFSALRFLYIDCTEAALKSIYPDFDKDDSSSPHMKEYENLLNDVELAVFGLSIKGVLASKPRKTTKPQQQPVTEQQQKPAEPKTQKTEPKSTPKTNKVKDFTIDKVEPFYEENGKKKFNIPLLYRPFTTAATKEKEKLEKQFGRKNELSKDEYDVFAPAIIKTYRNVRDNYEPKFKDKYLWITFYHGDRDPKKAEGLDYIAFYA